MGIEDPDVDVAEQHTSLAGLDDDGQELPDLSQLPLEADPADFADQHYGVPGDDS